MPVGAIARQARDLQSHDDAGLAEPHVRDQPLETGAIARRGARLALIAVDDDDSLLRPTERHCTPAQGYWRSVLPVFSSTWCRLD